MRALLIGTLAVLILLMGGTGLWIIGAQLQAQHNQQATTTTQTAPFATATAATNGYSNAVKRSGIQAGFHAGRMGSNPYEHLLTPTNVSQLHEAWTAPTGGSYFSSPVVANGVVYIVSSIGKLSAFDATTGQQKWTVSIHGVATPAVVGGIVYIGSDDGKLFAFDATTGQQKWVAPAGISKVPPRQ